MDRTVDGDKWVSRGWIRVLEVLYETDVTIELSHIRVTGPDSEPEYNQIESLHPESTLLNETDLTEDQAIIELNYLLDEKLVHYRRPFDDKDFVIYRLSEKGFEVAHELFMMEKQDEWRSENRYINLVLTLATGFLAATAVVQALTTYLDVPSPTNNWIAVSFILMLALIGILLVRVRSSENPTWE